MPRFPAPRALAERRPFLLASIAAALAFFYLRAGPWPEFYLVPIKGAALILLAAYAWLRHKSRDGRMLALLLLVGAAAEMALEVDFRAAHALFFLYCIVALVLLLPHRRDHLAVSQKRAVVALFLLPPLILYLLAGEWLGGAGSAAYGLALGGMAAAAWASSFPRYRTGAGVVLVMLANLLFFAGIGPLQGSAVPQIFTWPLAYLGQLLLCIGVLRTLHRRDPQLWLASHDRGSLH